MTMARYSGVVTDQAGNIITNAKIEVRRETPGQPLAALKSNRAGTAAISNPFDAEADGAFFFHVIGGAYQVRAYTGPSGSPTFEKILRYEPVGLAAELDAGVDVLIAPEQYGAVGDGVADDTVAIQAAIDAAGERGLLLLGAKTYRFTSALNHVYSYQEWRGSGKGATILSFQPTADGSAIVVGNGSESIWDVKLSGFRLHSPDTTYAKIGIDIVDARACDIEDVRIGGDYVGFGGTGFWGGGPPLGDHSIGIRVRGREHIRVHDSVSIVAQQGISIGENPNSLLDLDHCKFHAEVIADEYPCISTEGTAAYLSSSEFAGAWVGGSDGLKIDVSTATTASHTLTVCPHRLEQGQDGDAYNFNIVGKIGAGIQGVFFSDAYADPSRNGYYLRDVVFASINDANYGSTSKIALNADRIDNLVLKNAYWNTGASASIGATMNRIYAGPVTPSGAPLPGNAYYSTRAADFNATKLSSGIAGVVSGRLEISGVTSGTAVILPQSNAGSANLFLPTVSGTLVASVASPLALDAPTGRVSISKVPIVVEASAVASASHTGTTAETTIRTVVMPALSANARVVVEAVWSFTSGGSPGTRTVRHRYAGNGFHTQVCANTVLTYSCEPAFANRNATNSQIARNAATAGGWGVTTSAVTTFAADSSVTQNLTFTCQLADAGDSAVLQSYCVSIITP